MQTWCLGVQQTSWQHEGESLRMVKQKAGSRLFPDVPGNCCTCPGLTPSWLLDTWERVSLSGWATIGGFLLHAAKTTLTYTMPFYYIQRKVVDFWVRSEPTLREICCLGPTCHSSGERLRYLYSFPIIAVTNYHKLSGLKNTNLFSYSSRGKKS